MRRARFIGVGAAAAVLAGIGGSANLAVAQGGPPAAQAAAPDQVSVQINSWGKPLVAWTINADSSGVYRTAVQRSKAFNDYTIVTKRLDPAPSRYDQVISALSAAEAVADKPAPCANRITDAPYGSVSWRRHGVTRGIGLDFGCLSPENGAVFDQVNAANGLMDKWATESGVVEEPKPGDPAR